MALMKASYAVAACFLSATLGLLYFRTPMLVSVVLSSEEETVNSTAGLTSEDPLCLEERQVSWFTHPELYQATDACFDFAALFGQTCQRNTTKLQFHMAVMRRQQWNEPDIESTAFAHKAELALKSLLSAHGVDSCTIILWTDNAAKAAEALPTVRPFLEIREWSTQAELIGTPLEGGLSNVTLRELNEFHYTRITDLLRLVVLWKYGGFWLDLDVLVLRSFVPLSTGRDFTYQWGCQKTVNNAIIFARQGSAFITALMKELILRQENKDNYAWGVSIFGPVLERNPSLAQILPCCFFDADWLLSECDVSAWSNPLRWGFQGPMTGSPPELPSSSLFYPSSFAYHWHNAWDEWPAAGGPYAMLAASLEHRWERWLHMRTNALHLRSAPSK